MLEKFSQQQLDHKSLAEVAEIKNTALIEKANLENAKKSGKNWTKAMQDELDEVVMFLVDLDEYIEKRSKDSEKSAPEKEAEKPYELPKGTEKYVHLSIVRGRRYDPNTGKPISKAYVQMFTYSEWLLFKKNFRGLGYTIEKVLHDPYNEAAAFITKSE